MTEVKRNREWFQEKLPIMEALWNRVIWHRENGVEELLPKPKKERPQTARKRKTVEEKKCEIINVEDDDFFTDDF